MILSVLSIWKHLIETLKYDFYERHINSLTEEIKLYFLFLTDEKKANASNWK